MEDKPNAYVTNAVANSIAFYAMSFLNNQGYNPTQIRRMREKFCFENLNAGKFGFQELKSSFTNQSAYFLNLYNYMNKEDRFLKFAESTFQQDLYSSIFDKYEDFSKLQSAYERRIFHTLSECSYLLQPYDEPDGYFKNTGLFSKKLQKDEPKYYIVSSDWLIELGMRECQFCSHWTPIKF